MTNLTTPTGQEPGAGSTDAPNHTPTAINPIVNCGGGSGVVDETTTPVSITMPRRKWDTILDGLTVATTAYDGPGWCTDHHDLCEQCAARQETARTWAKNADGIRGQLGTRTGEPWIVFTAATWRETVRALRKGAAYLTGPRRDHCTHGDGQSLCDGCTAEQRHARKLRILAARIDRKVRRAHTHSR